MDLEKLHSAVLGVIAAITLTLLSYSITPRTHSLKGLIKACTIASVTAVLLYLWVWEDPAYTEFQKVVGIAVVCSVSEYAIIGLLKLFLVFMSDPMKMITDILSKWGRK